jgi:hypothetical protein
MRSIVRMTGGRIPIESLQMSARLKPVLSQPLALVDSQQMNISLLFKMGAGGGTRLIAHVAIGRHSK